MSFSASKQQVQAGEKTSTNQNTETFFIPAASPSQNAQRRPSPTLSASRARCPPPSLPTKSRPLAPHTQPHSSSATSKNLLEQF